MPFGGRIPYRVPRQRPMIVGAGIMQGENDFFNAAALLKRPPSRPAMLGMAARKLFVLNRKRAAVKRGRP